MSAALSRVLAPQLNPAEVMTEAWTAAIHDSEPAACLLVDVLRLCFATEAQGCAAFERACFLLVKHCEADEVEDGEPLKFDAATEYMERRGAAESSEKFNASTHYLLLSEVFRRDVCKGLDPQAVATLLDKRGHLDRDAKHLTKQMRLPGLDRTRVFVVKPTIFSDDMV